MESAARVDTVRHQVEAAGGTLCCALREGAVRVSAAVRTVRAGRRRVIAVREKGGETMADETRRVLYRSPFCRSSGRATNDSIRVSRPEATPVRKAAANPPVAA